MSKDERFRRLFRNGRTIIVPMDHGTTVPVPGLESPGQLISALSEFVDGYVLNYGAAVKFRDELTGKGVILRADCGNTCLHPGDPEGSYSIFGAEAALAVNATAVMAMCFPGHENEASIIRNCANLVRDCHVVDLPVIIETLPYGINRPDDYTSENILFCARLAAELGADIVKTAYPGDRDAFRMTCADSFAPVVVLGGKFGGNPESLVRMVADAMAAGAAGMAVGRNVWQYSHPLNLAECLFRVVHDRMSADEALQASPL